MEGKKGDREGEKARFEDAALLVSKCEEGPMGQAVQAASRSWKKKMSSPQSLQKEHSPAEALISSP